MDQGFLNFTEKTNHSRILSNIDSDSRGQGWSATAFLTSSQVMLMLHVHRPHSGQQGSTRPSPPRSMCILN